jgi:hypothetical protein
MVRVHRARDTEQLEPAERSGRWTPMPAASGVIRSDLRRYADDRASRTYRRVGRAERPVASVITAAANLTRNLPGNAESGPSAGRSAAGVMRAVGGK